MRNKYQVAKMILVGVIRVFLAHTPHDATLIVSVGHGQEAVTTCPVDFGDGERRDWGGDLLRLVASFPGRRRNRRVVR